MLAGPAMSAVLRVPFGKVKNRPVELYIAQDTHQSICGGTSTSESIVTKVSRRAR